MISLADFKPLSIAYINIFHQQPGFCRQIYQCQSSGLCKLLGMLDGAVSADSQVKED